MKTFKLFANDLFLGTWLKLRYVVFAAVLFIFFQNFLSMAQMYEAMADGAPPTFGDCLAFYIQGIIPASRNGSMEDFAMPMQWLLIVLLMLLMPLDYPVRSMELWGIQYMIRASSRRWWIAKTLYTLAVNVVTFALYLGEIALLCLFYHIPLSMEGSRGFYELLFSTADLNGFTMPEMWKNALLLIILPFLGLWAMSMVQLFISVWLGPFTAWLIMIFTLILSVFFNFVWLPGCHTMAIRSSLIDSQGLHPLEAVIGCLCIGLFALAAGWILIRHKDMAGLKKEES